MRTLGILLAVAGLCFGAPKKGSTSDLLTKLRDDTKRAAAIPEIKDKDRKTIDKAVAKLDKQIDAAEQGKKVSAGDVRKSMDDIGKVAKTTFKEDDRKVVYDDMAAIRDKKIDQDKPVKNPNNQRRNTNTNPFPNPRGGGRNPRF
jgi:hypothetical protein